MTEGQLIYNWDSNLSIEENLCNEFDFVWSNEGISIRERAISFKEFNKLIMELGSKAEYVKLQDETKYRHGIRYPGPNCYVYIYPKEDLK